MYDEHNNDQRNQESTPSENQGYHWNTPAPESGAYHGGAGERETFPQAAQSAQQQSNQQSSYQEQQTQAQQTQPAQEQRAEYVHAEPVHTPEHGRPIYEREHSRFGSGFHTGGNNGGNGGKKKTGAGKLVALALVCALGGGLVGGTLGSAAGGTLLHNASSTTVQVSDRTVSEVKEVKVDGQTELTDAENYAANVNSVVSINVGTQTNYFGQTVEQASSGSGFVLTQDGYILTNYHVVEDASSIEVTTYSGDTYEAEYIGGDEDYDIAVIKVDVTGLSPVTIGDSDSINVGDSVIAIGNPLGELTFSLTSGSVSSANRAITVDGTPFNMIQTDCSINPGNSGGPLLNSYGEVIGIVSAKYSSYNNTTVEGLGFAIPINDVYAMVQDIMENGYVTDKAYLGITGGSVTQQLQMQYNLPASSGVYVYSIEQDGAAAQSGLRAGDIIIKLDDTEISSMTDLLTAKKSYKAGDTVVMTVNRSGEEVTLDFTFGAEPQSTEDEAQSSNSSDDNSNDSYSYYYSNPFSGSYGG